jgi:hypothetical protein
LDLLNFAPAIGYAGGRAWNGASELFDNPQFDRSLINVFRALPSNNDIGAIGDINLLSGTVRVPPNLSRIETPFDPEQPLYRVIRPEEDPTVGLLSKNPEAKYSPEGFVLHGSKENFRSQFIATTNRLDSAIEWAKSSGNRVIQIDPKELDRSKIIDLATKESREAILKGKTARNRSAKSSEILIEGGIPSKAILSIIYP